MDARRLRMEVRFWEAFWIEGREMERNRLFVEGEEKLREIENRERARETI
jgi:hypothetical protein